ncbi:MAG: hypothetical protein ACI84C_001443 [Flavobacteriales bacterium]|jgi:hypothetical protein
MLFSLMKTLTMKSILSYGLALVAVLGFHMAQGQIWSQDFETDQEGVEYTSSNTFNDGISDHFGRTDGTNVNGGYGGQAGTFFWAGEDLDDDGGDGSSTKTLTFAAIDITGATNMQFRGLFASGNPDTGWDDGDVLLVEYNIDAAGWLTLMEMTTDLPGSNQGMYYDTDGDLIGDLQMNSTFTQIIKSFAGAGFSLEIRLTATANSGGERLAFDNFQVFDNPVAVNGCTDPTADNYDSTATVDDGSCAYSGCMDTTALNYDSGATIDDGSCIFTLPNLIINEIHYNGDDVGGFPDATVEFIEIYNHSGAAVDLENYSLVGVTFTFGAAVSIADQEYIVIATTAATYSGNGYQVFECTGTLSNSGELVQLLDSNGLVVDEVTYDDFGDWDVAADGTGTSLELINFDLDNNAGLSWCANGAVNGSPGAVNSCFMAIVNGCTNPAADNYDSLANVEDGSCVIGGCMDTTALNFNSTATYDDGSCVFTAPDIVINELHYNPCTAQGDDTVFEFLELYNNDVMAIDLSGWQLANGVTFTFPALTSIAMGEYIVIAVNETSYLGNGYQVFQWSGGLNNTSEPVTLLNASAALVDEVTYDDGAPWPSSPDGACPTLELIDPALDNSDPANWQASWVANGTPGAINSTEPPAIALTIAEIQSEVYTGQFVSTTGVVTAVYGASNLFTIQEGPGGNSGVWVSGAGVALGDEVDVEGTVLETNGLTLLSSTGIIVQTSGNALPAAEVLTTLALNDEQWEGVLCVVLGNVDNGDVGFGEWSVNDGSGSALVDDLAYLFTPAPDGISFQVTGPLYYSFGGYKLEPRDANDVVRYGCTDTTFANYDALATVDDGSCGNIPGCTNPAADNYDSTATIDDGTCIVSGCMNSLALNYDSTATIDDASCYLTEPLIVINEIHYNPCFTQGDDFVFEFLELHNADVMAVDLSGFTFAQGFDFTFPEGSSIAAGEYIILAVTAASYTGNGYQVFEIEFGNLSNTASTVELQDAWTNIIDIVSYEDGGLWPSAADGNCPSLELIDPSLDNSDPANWQASWIDYGTPGAINSTPPEGCMDTMADNYDPIAVIDDGSCQYLGCMDTAAANYDSTANTDDGSCIYPGCTYPDADNYDSSANDDDGTCTFTPVSACPTDLNNDGVTNTQDLLLFLGQFGIAC